MFFHNNTPSIYRTEQRRSKLTDNPFVECYGTKAHAPVLTGMGGIGMDVKHTIVCSVLGNYDAVVSGTAEISFRMKQRIVRRFFIRAEYVVRNGIAERIGRRGINPDEYIK